jgi:putative hydrolase of the HAD superfamily
MRGSAAACPSRASAWSTRVARFALPTTYESWRDREGQSMQPDARAVLFDLDDTLYPLREFVRSGFAAVAKHLETTRQIGRGEAFRFLTRASDGSARGRELQACAVHFDLSLDIVPELVGVIRDHAPSITLPLSSRQTIEALRPEWAIGVVTNGLPDVQARKVRALGLEPLVDCVIYAHAVGDGRGKPEGEPFLAAARRCGVAVERTVFVGDDGWCDIFGARRAGMKTIHVMPRRAGALTEACLGDATVATLADVPAIASRLVDHLDWSAHVA